VRPVPSVGEEPQVAIALEAMATRFELLLFGEDAIRLRAVGEEALGEIARAEERLSRYRPTSEIAWINAGAGGAPVRVSPPVFRLLERCAELARLTEGAFDPTVGPLVRFGAELGPRSGEAATARGLVGMHLVRLDAADHSVRLPEPGMELDLGAIGKGAAIDTAIEVLREHGVPAALLHGGTSSVHTIGPAPGGGTWRIGWRVPGESEPRVVDLDRERPALAVSAPHGRALPGAAGGHVLDPRTGKPAHGVLSALVRGPSSTLCDALSTALLVRGADGWRLLAERFPDYVGEVAA